jgi:hypothetical protein
LLARIKLAQGQKDAAREAATTALKHYRIDNDDEGAGRAQKFLDSLQ